MTRTRHVVHAVVAVGLAAAIVPPVAAATAAAPDWWQPGQDVTWQVQLSRTIDTSVVADAYEVDLVETPKRVVDELHAKGRKVICYLSAGSWERWRPDAKDFPKSVRGKKLDGWPGERWLDIRRLDVLGPIMEARLDECVAKGFDGADFDNVDGYQNKTGFKLTAADQRAYNEFLANAAHERGLAAALKNDLGQIVDLEPAFDLAVNEECADYKECAKLRPFADAGKAIVIIEYALPLKKFCGTAADLGAYAMKKKLSLNAWRRACT